MLKDRIVHSRPMLLCTGERGIRYASTIKCYSILNFLVHFDHLKEKRKELCERLGVFCGLIGARAGVLCVPFVVNCLLLFQLCGTKPVRLCWIAESCRRVSGSSCYRVCLQDIETYLE